jgi:hypothetical protein
LALAARADPPGDAGPDCLRTAPALPPWIVNRLAHLDLNHGPIAKYFQHLAHEGTPKAKAVLVKADQVADSLGLDDKLIDLLLVKLGLE